MQIYTTFTHIFIDNKGRTGVHRTIWRLMICSMTKEKVKLHVMKDHIVSRINWVTCALKIHSNTC